jgi:hypothetical protein
LENLGRLFSSGDVGLLCFVLLCADVYVALLSAMADGMEPSRTPCLILLMLAMLVYDVTCASTWQGGGAVLDKIK